MKAILHVVSFALRCPHCGEPMVDCSETSWPSPSPDPDKPGLLIPATLTCYACKQKSTVPEGDIQRMFQSLDAKLAEARKRKGTS